jgi:hypothetical protein
MRSRFRVYLLVAVLAGVAAAAGCFSASSAISARVVGAGYEKSNHRAAGGAITAAPGAGLHEVSMAIDSTAALSAQERIVLKQKAHEILAKDGRLDLAKKKVVFSQTRSYLLAKCAQLNNGGKEGAILLERFFSWDFTNYVRLPDVTPVERRKAKAIFNISYVALKKFVNRSFTDTPPALRERISHRVGQYMQAEFGSACDYYHPQLLYPDSHVPSLGQIIAQLKRDPFSRFNATAFASTAASLRAKGISKITRHDLTSGFIWSQAQSLDATIGVILRKYFHGNDAARARVCRPYPRKLLQQSQAFGVKQFQKAQKRDREMMNPFYNSSLFPTGRQILKGSGVSEPQ